MGSTVILSEKTFVLGSTLAREFTRDFPLLAADEVRLHRKDA